MGASKHILDDFAENLKDIALVEKPPKLEGKSMSHGIGEKHNQVIDRRKL